MYIFELARFEDVYARSNCRCEMCNEVDGNGMERQRENGDATWESWDKLFGSPIGLCIVHVRVG